MNEMEKGFRMFVAGDTEAACMSDGQRTGYGMARDLSDNIHICKHMFGHDTVQTIMVNCLDINRIGR